MATPLGHPRPEHFSNFFSPLKLYYVDAKLQKNCRVLSSALLYLPECPPVVSGMAGGVLQQRVSRGPALAPVRRQVNPNDLPAATGPGITCTMKSIIIADNDY